MESSSLAPASPPVASIYQAIGLHDDPFPRDPDAGIFVELESQMSVLADIREWLDAPVCEEPGLAVVAGPNGAGKTRLLGRLVASLADADRLIGVVPGNGSRRSDAQLLRESIVAIGGAPGGRTGLELTTELRAMLDEHRDNPLPPVVLIDNAALTGSQLEIVRHILTSGTPEALQTRVQIVLFGPPELSDRIARRRALADLTRKTVRLSPLSGSAIASLVTARVESVRDPEADPLFTPEALRHIGELSQGSPGVALALAHAAVREAIATGRGAVDTIVASSAAVAVLAQRGPAPRPRTADDDEGAIQTRLSLPGLDQAAETPPLPRRRGQQR